MSQTPSKAHKYNNKRLPLASRKAYKSFEKDSRLEISHTSENISDILIGLQFKEEYKVLNSTISTSIFLYRKKEASRINNATAGMLEEGRLSFFG